MNRPSPSRAVSRVAAQPSRMSAQARLALVTGGIMLASISISSFGLAMARADEKDDRRSRQYKIGAGVLGGAALYYGLKKKNPIGTVVTGAAAYYALKKSKEHKQNSERDRYGYNGPLPGQNAGDIYPEDNGYDPGYNVAQPGYGYGRGNDGYPAGGYDSYPRDVLGDDYGTNEEYAQNGDYPDYGLNGLQGRRKNMKSAAPKVKNKSRISVK